MKLTRQVTQNAIARTTVNWNRRFSTPRRLR